MEKWLHDLQSSKYDHMLATITSTTTMPEIKEIVVW